MNLFPHFKQVALDSGHADNVDLNTDTIKVALISGYTYDSADAYVSDATAGGATIIARSAALTSPTVTNGTFDAADVTLSAVASGSTVTGILVYKDTGVDSSSVLIAHIDKQTDGSTAISTATNGSDIVVSFHASGIFDL